MVTTWQGRLEQDSTPGALAQAVETEESLKCHHRWSVFQSIRVSLAHSPEHGASTIPWWTTPYHGTAARPRVLPISHPVLNPQI